MTAARLDEILKNMEKLHIGVLGDVCVDIYWHADMTKSSLSRETPMFPLPIYKEEFSLGAAGNSAVNLKALGVRVSLCSLIGDDWRALLLLRAAQAKNISTDFLITEPGLVTSAYCKPMRHGISSTVYEDARLDFANFHSYGAETRQKIISSIKKLARECDALVVVDQLAFLVNEAVRGEINSLDLPVFVDSRNHIGEFHHCIIKPNESEAFKALYPNLPEPLSHSGDEIMAMGAKLVQKHPAGVIITAGEKGTYWFKDSESLYTATHPASPPVDVVGCGDNFMACFAAALTAGASVQEASILGNLGSGVTVKKIGTTGSSSPEELRHIHREHYL